MEMMIETAPTPSTGKSGLEVVERKGLGHPDTVCDALADALSIHLCEFYLNRFGLVLHHNVDKALLCGGVAQPAFGGGEVVEPMEIILAGRATRHYRGVEVPLDDLVYSCVHSWFRINFRNLDPERHVRVRSKIQPGSAELVELFARQQEAGVLLANDTSCGVGYAPLSPLETAVYAIERHLNQPAVKGEMPEIGEDIKVMGVRRSDCLHITLACAFIDRYVSDAGDYVEKKSRVAELARDVATRASGLSTKVDINTADDPEKNNYYLTVTGTSAESGDDGEVGRGNRANGLITPFRPMTMEATAGKNPMTHVGKLYNVAAEKISAEVVASIEHVTGAECYLVSQIGRPIDDPATALLRLTPAQNCDFDVVKTDAEQIARDGIRQIPGLWKELAHGEFPLF
jgi:S-adenosylmethionine synthetase